MTFRLAEWLGDFEGGRRQLMHLTVVQLVLQAVTQLKLFDHMVVPMKAEVLAAKMGVQQDGLFRLLAFLAAEGVVEWDGSGPVSPTRQSALLQELSSTIGNYRLSMEAGLALDDALTDGGVAFEKRFGRPVFEYLRQDAEAGAIFADVMRVTTREVEAFLFSQYEFPSFTCAVDIGGNKGSLLVRLLEERPEASGILFDLPPTAAAAQDSLAASPVSERIECVGGSFFETIPPGRDLYLLKQILHDWSDEEALQILANTRRAMKAGTPLLVIERLMPESPQPCEAMDVDMLMMIWTSGRERSIAAYQQLLEESGFAVRSVVGETGGQGVIEAEAA